MPKIGKKNPLRLSLNVLRHGTKSLQSELVFSKFPTGGIVSGATNHETTKCLNIVGHFCLNVFASTAVFLTLASFLNSDKAKDWMSDVSFLLLAVCMWLQLAAVRHRTVIPLLGSVFCESVIVGFVVFQAIMPRNEPTRISDNIVSGIWLVFIVVRFMVTVVLYKVLTVKNPQFALSTTVFLKPTNTPVTFSSVLAPQDLDPTNPYHSKTVYNINDSHANSHNQTVA